MNCLGGVLGVDANLDRMAANGDVGLAVGKRLSARDTKHGLNEVDAGDHLGHRVLDLDAGVHLDEIEVAGRLVVEIFERAGAAVADAFREPHGGGAQRFAPLGEKADRGRLLPDLLTAALQRAFALVEMDRGLSIAEDLNLDMTGARDETLEVKASVPERGERLGARLRDLSSRAPRGTRRRGCRARRRQPPP